MTLWRCEGLHLALGARKLFDGLDLVVEEGECVGLVGVNGSGKSTLLQIAAGLRQADEAHIEKRRNSRMELLLQEPRFAPGDTIATLLFAPSGALAEAHQEHEALSRAIAENTGGAQRQESLLTRLEAAARQIELLGGWDQEHRARAMLDRMEVAERDFEKPVELLSGGLRKRIAIARALLATPDLLLLDEPTNHLDTATIDWLEEELDAFAGAILLVTHDRYFLDHLAERIVELEHGKLISYPGSFRDYLELKVIREEEAARKEHKRQRLIVQELAWLRRGPEARRTKRKSRVDAARKLIAERPPEVLRTAQLSLAAPKLSGHVLIEAKRLSKRFGERMLVSELDLLIERGEKIGIVGPNGIGKTTLLKTLLGEEAPSGGEAVRSKNLKSAWFDQTREALDTSQTVLEAASADAIVEVDGKRVELTSFLNNLLFPPPMQRLKVEALSGGEKSRLLLARLFLTGANLLVLDEPTNDLDLVTLELLEELLLEFTGGALIVTHDRYFLDKVATSILTFEGDGRVVRYPGNYEMYQRLRRQAAPTPATPIQGRATAERQAPEKSAPPSAKKKLTWSERNRLSEMEGLIEAAEAARAELEQALADPELYRSRGAEAGALHERLAECSAQVESLYAEWQELEARGRTGE